ncbi:protein-L-isoaspartate O-methyltransferase family protein [Streptomyces kaniharaensis]|uniref:hypothetical protein n=1 Tax=Streptomyces kaniharaensis TaxID=212423 RepID=UPI002DDD25EA|nr:hypothetical protein [Streptomyces kaniharaensis]
MSHSPAPEHQLPVTPAPAAGTLPPLLIRQITTCVRILQIGPGSDITRQLAALSGDTPFRSVQPDLAGVESVRATLGPCSRNRSLVDIHIGDLAHGRPDQAPYDLIVSTVPVKGIPRAWLGQLAKGGALAVPLALAGRHPWVVAENRRSGLRARLLTEGADYWPVPVAGPLYPEGGDTPASRPSLPAPDPGTRRLSAVGALREDQWADLWAYLAIHHPDLVTVARVDGRRHWGQTIALVDGRHAVYVRPDGLWATSDRRRAKLLADQAEKAILHWGWAHRPRLPWWVAELAHATESAGGLLLPDRWHIDRIRVEYPAC